MALTQVSSKGIKDGTILNEDVNASANIAGSKLADNSITLAKLVHGDSNNNGKFLRANNGADPTFETIDLTALSASNLTSGTIPNARFPATLPAASATNLTNIPAANITGTLPAIDGSNLTGISSDLVDDTTPQLGGNLDTNGNQILVGDGGPGNTDENICVGDSKDLKIYHDGNSVLYDNGGGDFLLYSNGGAIKLSKDTGDKMLVANIDGAVELYFANSKKLETVNDGVNIIGRLGIGDNGPDYEIDINAPAPMIRLEETSTGGSKRLDLGVTSSGNPYIAANQSSQSIAIETSGYRRFTFGTSEMYTANDGTDFSWPSNPGHILYQSGEYRSTSANGTHIRCNRMNGDGHVAQWYRGHTNMVGFISISSSGTSYGSGSSDERTKKNIEDWSESVLNKFKSLTPKLFNFNWEDDTAAKHKGYIAQNEVNKFPEAYPKNNLTDCDDEFYTFTPTDMTVYLMKGLKEAAEKIAALETKVAALEAA